jgi:hypothetical protein
VVPEFDYRDVLIKAASYVEQGWCQGVEYEGEDIPLYPGTTDPHLQGFRDLEASLLAANKWCAVGAIKRAAFETLPVDLDDRMDAFNGLIWLAIDNLEIGLDNVQHRGFIVTSYNDAEGRTADEVADALRRAAE